MTGSTRFETIETSSEAVIKLVMHEMMQMDDSGRTLDNVVAKISMLPQDNVWQFFRAGLARTLFLLTWFRMLESPIKENSLDMMNFAPEASLMLINLCFCVFYSPCGGQA